MAVIVGVLTGLSVRTEQGWYELEVPEELIQNIKEWQGRVVHVYGSLVDCDYLKLGEETITIRVISVKHVKPIF